jgi:hypothetical protein
VALVRTDISDERSASIIRVTRINELGTMLTVISKLKHSCYPDDGRCHVSPKRRFLQEPHGVTSQEMVFIL